VPIKKLNISPAQTGVRFPLIIML